MTSEMGNYLMLIRNYFALFCSLLVSLAGPLPYQYISYHCPWSYTVTCSSCQCYCVILAKSGKNSYTADYKPKCNIVKLLQSQPN